MRELSTYDFILYGSMVVMLVTVAALIVRRFLGAHKGPEIVRRLSYQIHLGAFVLIFIVIAVLVLTHLGE